MTRDVSRAVGAPHPAPMIAAALWLALATGGCAATPSASAGDRDAGARRDAPTVDAATSATDAQTTEARATDATATTDSATRDGAAPPWPAGFVPAPRSVPAGRLCTITADYVQNGGDPVNPPCVIEADTFSDRPRAAPPPATLTVATYNIHYGHTWDAVKQALTSDATLARADVLLLQEVARYDTQSAPPQVNQARELARALAMNYVYAVVWDFRLLGGGEHGQAILSKYPIGNVDALRLSPLDDHYGKQQRYGGRLALGADLAVGQRRVRVYNIHLATTDLSGAGRAKQGAEVRADAAKPQRPTLQIAGGDFNTALCSPLIAACNGPPAAEPVVKDFLAGGWSDLLDGWRGFTFRSYVVVVARLDYLFGRGLAVVDHHVLQGISASDHVPLLSTVALP